MSAQPSVGRIVHYWSIQEAHHEPWAAIITGLWDSETGSVRLHIYPNGCMEDPVPESGAYPYAEEPTPGHWNWPPRA